LRGDGNRNRVDATPISTPSHRYNRWEQSPHHNKRHRNENSRDINNSSGGSRNRNVAGWEDDEQTDEEEMLADDELNLNWYGAEESDATDLTKQIFVGNEEKMRKREEDYAKRTGAYKVSARKSQMIKDNDAWEENRMRQSGVVRNREIDMDFDEEDENKVQIIVHDVKPPFLDGDISFTSQSEPIYPVADPTSDMAVMSRKGSLLLREVRSQRERMKAVKAKFKLSGTSLGKILGIKEDNAADDTTQSISDNTARANMSNQESDSYAVIQQKRKTLPVYQCRDELLQIIRENNVIVIVGETGSGKTTQLTQYLHESGFTKNGKIGCTQPRRVAAMSVAKRVSEEIGCKLGSTVGYSIRFEDVTSDETLIKYMTDGVLLRESLHDPDLDQYSAIIMDEAHERSLNTDVLFGILRKVIAKRRDLKLIVTSATMDSTKFSNFFGNVPVYTIPGRTFPVDVLYTRAPVSDYIEASVKQALSIHLMTPTDGDILIFMTGQEDIEVTCYVLEERFRNAIAENEGDKSIEDKMNLHILPIYSMLPSELQARIFERSAPGHRKCIVATNIAETSLTVDGIYYVIDSGFCKLKVFNPKVGMDALQVYPESQAGAKQRAGRAGRTGPGTCYRMFTEQQYQKEMLPNNIPEIQRTNLGNVILLLKSLGVENLLEFDFMDPPPEDNMKNSMYQLWILGALDNNGSLTRIGRRMIEFPLDPPLSKMLSHADELGCTNEILTVVSMLSVPTVFYRPKDREDESDAAREKFQVPESDHLTLLNVYQQWKMNKYSASWCAEHFLHYKALRKVQEIRTQIADILHKSHIDLVSCGSNWDVVRKAICAGYFHHTSKLKGIGEYVNMITGMPCHLHPTSALYGMGFTPDYVVYHELVMTTKEYMQCVTSVDGNWLAELCPTFFSVKRSHVTREERRKVARDLIQSETPQRETPGSVGRIGAQQTPSTNPLSFGTSVRAPTPRRTPRRLGL